MHGLVEGDGHSRNMEQCIKGLKRAQAEELVRSRNSVGLEDFIEKGTYDQASEDGNQTSQAEYPTERNSRQKK